MSPRRLLVAALIPVLLWSAACTGTGTGWLQSSDGVNKATFGFTYDDTTNDLSGSYRDPHGTIGGLQDPTTGVVSPTVLNVDVAFKGLGKLLPCSGAGADVRCSQAPAGTKGGCMAGEPEYQSQNPAIPGGGLVFLLLCDLDGDGTAGAAGQDFIFLTVDTGPYAGYRNLGNPQGNLTVTQP